MIESLKIHSADFHIYVLGIDSFVCSVLKGMSIRELTVIPLEKLEDLDLLKVKSDRTISEYCWTCTSSLILYCLENYDIPHCTYIDADICFYSDPAALVDEIGGDDVLITEHRYSKEYDQSETSGIYCVQFLTFKNTRKALQVLKWWRKACLKWCYARFEDGKFGDQKYLDDWPVKFSGIRVMKCLGGGLAPWNIRQYSVDVPNSVLGYNGARVIPVFYHFHGLKIYSNGFWKTEGQYNLPRKVQKLFYARYVKRLYYIERDLKLDLPAANVYCLTELLSAYILGVGRTAISLLRLVLGKSIWEMISTNREYHRI